MLCVKNLVCEKTHEKFFNASPLEWKLVNSISKWYLHNQLVTDRDIRYHCTLKNRKKKEISDWAMLYMSLVHCKYSNGQFTSAHLIFPTKLYEIPLSPS